MFIAHIRDGRTLKETDVDWKEVPQEDITSLQLYRQGNYYTVSADGKNVKYVQLKRTITGVGPMPQGVCERVIGFVLDEKYAIKMEVDERTGNVKLTVEEKVGKKWRKL